MPKIHKHLFKKQFVIVSYNDELWEVPYMPDGWDSKTRMPSSAATLLSASTEMEHSHQEWVKKYLKMQ
jgi:hypothetical protein